MMKIAITGANGFVGRQVVREALKQGIEVVALVRSLPPKRWKQERINVVRCDLLEFDSLPDIFYGCDVVIHLASVASNIQQYTQSIEITNNVLEAMATAKVEKLIGLSSISVLDYSHQGPMTVIDEETPVNTRSQELGFYALMKRDQERLYQKWQNSSRIVSVLRAGSIYDGDELSSAHAGFVRGRAGISAHHIGYVPVVHRESVAEAIIAAVSNLKSTTLHLVNDDLPTQSRYLAELSSRGIVKNILPLPWRVFSILMQIGRSFFSLAGEIPDSFRINSIAARQKPFQFNNRNAKNVLNWYPRILIED